MAFHIRNNQQLDLILTNGGFIELGSNLKIEGGKLDLDVSGLDINVDDQLSTTSTNAVQNKVITNKINNIENSVNRKADISSVYTKSEVDSLLEDVPSTEDIAETYLSKSDASSTYQPKGNYLTPADITGKANVGDSYTKAESDAKYLTEHQDISGKANVGDCYTKVESDAKYLTEHQSLDAYLTKQEASNTYLTKQTAQSDYLTKLEASQTYITEHQSLEDYLTIADAADTYATIEDVREIDVVTAAALNDLEQRKANSSDVSDEIDSKIAELGSTYYTKIESDSKFVGFDKLEADELVISSSLNDLNARVESLENQEQGVSRNEFDEFKQDSEDNELVVTTALTDLNDRIAELEQRIQALES